MNVHVINPAPAKACAALFLLRLDSQKETFLSLESPQFSYFAPPSPLKVCVFSQDSQVRPSTTYSLHQPQGNKEHGTERSGYLYKKSDG